MINSEIASKVGPVPGKDPSKLSSGDAEGSFEYINSFMYSETMLTSEDRGMGNFLALKDIVEECLLTTNNPIDVGETNIETSKLDHTPPFPSETSQSDAAQSFIDTSSNISQEEVPKIISDYDIS